MATTNQFVPPTQQEVSELERKLLALVETQCGKEIQKAFRTLEALKLFANHGVTEKGQPMVIKARRYLNKFLGAS